MTAVLHINAAVGVYFAAGATSQGLWNVAGLFGLLAAVNVWAAIVTGRKQ